MSLISRFKWLTRTLVAVTFALLFALATTISAFASASLLQLSSDPFTNTASQHATEVEPDTFAAGSTFVSAFQVGRVFGGGAADIGFATSSNGGKSFSNGFLPDTTTAVTPPGIYAAVSDASVAFDARHGVWLISFLGLSPNGSNAVDVLISRSTDGGSTWSNPVVVNNSGHFNDKNWTACDNTATSPFYGHCYTEFDDNSLRDLIQMSTSTDGGLTWGAALPTANDAHGIGGQPLVQPNGTVIVPINGFAGRNFLMVSFTSADGGASWSKTNIIARVGFHHAAGGIRDSIPLPSAEMDASGKVYAVWQDCHFEPTCNASDLILSTSTDGKSWSKLTRIPLDPRGSGVDHFFPGLAVDRSTSGSSAKLAVIFYFYPNANCTTSTCQLNVGFSTSADGGATWSSNSQLAGPMSLTWLPNTSQGFMVGDYMSTSFVGSPAFPAFEVASAPTSGGSDCFTATPHCNVPTFTVKGGLNVGGSANPASDQTNAGSNDTQTDSTITDQ
ncbi:MAG TPA: sialidase family protein [Ktedonobacteraceae bacterium]